MSVWTEFIWLMKESSGRLVHTVCSEPLVSLKAGDFLISWVTISISEKYPVPQSCIALHRMSPMNMLCNAECQHFLNCFWYSEDFSGILQITFSDFGFQYDYRIGKYSEVFLGISCVSVDLILNITNSASAFVIRQTLWCWTWIPW
jgi:hypothetical protein